MKRRDAGVVVIAVLMGLCQPQPARAQSAVRDVGAGQFRAHLPLAGEFDVAQGVGDFVARGDHLYVAAADPDGEWRIFIYDISNRSAPRFISPAPIASQPGARFRLNTVAVQDHWLYTAGDSDDLFVIDIEQPTLPVIFVRSDALVNDLEDTFDIDFFGFQFSEVQDIRYRKLIIEDGSMYVLFDFTVDTDALFVPELTNSSVAVIDHVDDFPLRICGREDCRQTGTQTRDVLLGNLADTGDDIKSMDYEDGRLFLGFDELLDVVPVGESGDNNIELDRGGCGGFFDCLKDLFIGGDDDPYRDLVVDGDTVYIVFTDGLLVKKVKAISGEDTVEQTEILKIEPTLSFQDGDGFFKVFIDDDNVYLADEDGDVLVLDEANTATPGVVGAVVNASSNGRVTAMEESFGDFFVATDDNGLFILTAFGFEGGSGSGGCTAGRGGQMGGMGLALLLSPLLAVAAWRGRRRRA